MSGRRIRFADDVHGHGVVKAPVNAPTPGGMLFYDKQARTDQFLEWRRGNYNWVESDRQDEIRSTVHPRPGAWDPWDLTDPAAESGLEQLIKDSRQRYQNPGNANNDNQAHMPGLMEEEDPEVAERMVADTISITESFQAVGFGKVAALGVGGRKATFRFGMQDIERNVHNVVVQVDLADDLASHEEVGILKRLSGAQHVTQRLLLQAMPDPEFDPDAPLPPRDMPTAVGDAIRQVASLAISPRNSFTQGRNRIQRTPSAANTRARRIRRARRELDDEEEVIVMEYIPRGDLGSWLERLARLNAGKEPGQRIRPPEKVLWSIFRCLWHGCIAMGWPGAQAAASGLDRRRNQIPVQTETLPASGGRANRPTDPLVHFNLNPSKVLIGDFDEEHVFPVLKISDFSLAKLPKWDTFDMLPGEREKYLWNLRSRGQIDSLLPEQTSVAWDFMPNIDSLRASAIAGNYGAASNVFHIGLIMWQLVTTWKPEVPFVPRPYSVQILAREASGWTYGHALLDQYEDWTSSGQGQGDGEASVWPSDTLRNTIAHCMDYMPQRRMNLTRLGTTIRMMLEEWEWAESDDECRQWVQQLFDDAPAQSASVT